MNNIKHTYLFLLIYVIISFESPVSCDPTDESRQGEEIESIDIDIKNIDSDKLQVLTCEDSPEVRKIAARGNKVINSVKIDQTILWKRSTKTECLNLLTFKTQTDKIFITLNTKNDGKKLYINLVYDPTEEVGSGVSDEAVGGSKIRYVGLLPFLIELNEEFGTKTRVQDQIGGTQLNIEDMFDKWYYNHSSKTIKVHDSAGYYTLVYDVYEPNEKETFSEIRDSNDKIWSSLQEEDTLKMFLKRVEVYSMDGKPNLLKLTSTYDLNKYYSYDSKRKYFRESFQSEFEKKFRTLGFNESIKDLQSGSQSTFDGNVIESLDIAGINKSNFNFVKHKLSSVRIVTAVPKEKKRVNELKFSQNKSFAVESGDYSIDLIKWHDDKYNSETIVRNDHNYNCHYTEHRKYDDMLDHYNQEVFYELLKTRIARKEQQYITYTPFKFLYYSKDTIYAPEPEKPTSAPVQSSEQEQLEGSSEEKSPESSDSETLQKSPDTNPLATDEIDRLSTQGIQTTVNSDDLTTEINQLEEMSRQSLDQLNIKKEHLLGESTTLGEGLIDTVEKMIQNIEKLESKEEGAVEQRPLDGEDNRKTKFDEAERSYFKDSLEFLKALKSKYGASKPVPVQEEKKETVVNQSPVEGNKSGFMSTGLTITILIISTVSLW